MNQLDFDFGVAVFSDYDDDGHLEIGVDSPGLDGKAGTVPAEALGPGGLAHRPLDPDKDSAGTATQGAGLLTIMHGDKRHVFTLNDDVRTVPKLPKVRKGGTMLYGGAGTYRTFLVVDGLDPEGAVQPGSLMAMTPYSKAGAKKTHLFSMLVREAGDESVILAHGEGHGLTLTTSGERAATLKNAEGDSSIVVNDRGIALRGKTKMLGALTVGDPGAAQQLVLAQILITYLTALEARIASAVGVGPPTLPIAAVASSMTTQLLKGL